MSYVVQQLQNWLISWMFNWFKMVSVRFLGRKCFIQPLLSSEFSIDLCFDDMLEQHGVGLKKPHMHIYTEYFDWMVFVTLNLTRLFAELVYFMLHVPLQAINTRDLTLLLALMKFWAWSAKFCRLNPWFLACNIKLAHACGFISNLHSSIVDN